MLEFYIRRCLTCRCFVKLLIGCNRPLVNSSDQYHRPEINSEIIQSRKHRSPVTSIALHMPETIVSYYWNIMHLMPEGFHHHRGISISRKFRYLTIEIYSNRSPFPNEHLFSHPTCARLLDGLIDESICSCSHIYSTSSTELN